MCSSNPLASTTLYREYCNCNAPVRGADVKCPCLDVYHCGHACQYHLEHKHKCTHHLRKGIKKKGAVISRLQVQGSSDGVDSVELMVLEQELAWVHYKVGRLMGASLLPSTRQQRQTSSRRCTCIKRWRRLVAHSVEPGLRQANWLIRRWSL